MRRRWGSSGAARTSTGGKAAARAHALAADMLAELEAAVRNMVTVPPGAGRGRCCRRRLRRY
ncbi:MAG TPA: hypothetical protein VJY34_22795 [Roseiarcus sp.]|nr:hypothetical protein [Roseiarcus sp.]